ncbi:hypothetical protein L228DRAFT_237004 [Xylona heveae TC161]|uniref:Peptidase S1 domain-containing protein n=1 Tax=Xylona heveae (strain CBS 132557 / TC161) TaxID=1328760 RepID=A0A165HWT9_XYLHT|nr:hypothetical protein L228DRAFT_237004 [Xylona heveae TC161]KZF24035.1 hypothetical protein L228DRAFT_237004 [Xylona heveae TC161]
MGGYIELFKEDDQKKRKSYGIYGLTCWHVVEDVIPDGEVRKRYNDNGMNPGDANGKKVGLLCPGKNEHLSYLKQIDYAIERRRNTPKASETAIRLTLEKDASLQAWDEHGKLGHLFCGSGHKRNGESHRLDWALIKVDQERIGTNKLPSRETWDNLPCNSRMIVPIHLDKLTKIGNRSQSSEYVFQVGNVSKASIGEFSEMRSDCLLKGETVHSIEYCFTGRGGLFAQEGDSGALVYDMTCSLVGMVFLGNSMFYNPGVTYVMDIKHLVKDIEERTGCKVGLPQ